MMTPRRNFLAILALLSAPSIAYGFVQAPITATSRTSTSLFGAVSSNDEEISRRAAIASAAAVAAGGTIAVFGTPEAAEAAFGQTAPLFEQVKAVENANNMGSLKKINPPNSKGAPEKHLPQVQVSGQDVTVSVPHVMTEEHYIRLMWLKDAKTNENVLVKGFPPTEPSPPTLKAKVPAGVELIPCLYCNLHGYWKGESFKVADA